MYEVWMALAGYRETPKYYVAKSTDLVRRRALAAGHALAEQGRLDRPEQVFDLHLDEVDRALADRSLDLRALARDNTAYLRRFASVSGFPRLVDSRGKIPRLPQGEAKEGELAGQAISPGVVRGPIKTLRDPEEKPVQRGDILVARATDPGWTPLFINAAGIILEVGGALQHGALVAREYGKPCVSGIDQALETLADGEIVEVDGTHGVVRLLERRSV
jgi:phosphohistidine swiveling domain-containing protein